MTDHASEAELNYVKFIIPPELFQNRDDIKRFVDAMLYKLKRNARKGRWGENTNADRLPTPIPDLLKRLRDEVDELEAAIREGNTAEIVFEAADVANFAMILANVALADRK